jgi:5-formyltetrahydrofolate cyclo-ligase
MLEQRRRLSDPERALLGLHAQKMCLELPAFVAAGVIALYAPVHNEVETSLLLTTALAAGKRVLFPVVAEKGLEFRRVSTPAALCPGKFGIKEPTAECDLYQPNDIEFFLVPGVAFDLSCRRVGYGKGYYDKALHELEGQGRMAGFCYDFQVVEAIPAAPHDVQMDMVITDRRVISFPGQFT